MLANHGGEGCWPTTGEGDVGRPWEEGVLADAGGHHMKKLSFRRFYAF